MHEIYKKLAPYFDSVFSLAEYEQEVAFLVDFVGRNSLHYSLLDVGCGTGEHLKLLAPSFQFLQGIDLNSEVLTEARKKNPKVIFECASMSQFQLNRCFDVVTCFNGVFNYNLDDRAAVETLLACKKHMHPGGILMVVLYSPKNEEKKVSLHMGKKDDGGEIVKINQFSFNPVTNLETSAFVVFTKSAAGEIDFTTELNHQYKIYPTEKFTQLCQAVGFKSVEFFDGFTKRPVHNDTLTPVAIIRC
jgi:trans-aconitate methyltransferase